MRELKVYKMVDQYYCDDSFCVEPSDVYLKSEVDEAIAELNRLSNFAMAVIQRLENCERTAREQDNHHYYKIFADSVRKLAAKLQGGDDVEN